MNDCKNKKISVIDDSTKLWFCARDVAKVLNFTSTQKVTEKVNKEDKKYKYCHTNGGKQQMVYISSKGLHKVLYSKRNMTEEQKRDIYGCLTGCKYEEVFNDCKEMKFLNKLKCVLEPFNIKDTIEQYKILNYKIDLYIPSLNIAIEYDENNHKGYTYTQHKGRQKEIEDKLGCKFIRVSDKNSDEYNIGYIIKVMFDIKNIA